MTIKPENIRPIEQTPQLPDHLNGKFGENRAEISKLQISVSHDIEAILLWINRYDASPHTKRSYRKEIERLFLWAVYERQKPFSSLRVEDIQDYLKFAKNPSPIYIWMGPRRSREDPRWRPFEKCLQESSRKQVMTILGACFSFLVAAGYLVSNPVKLLSKSNRPKPYQAAIVERYIEQPVWDFFWQFIIDQPTKTATQIRHYERNRFIFSLLYEQSPRASEVVSHQMRNIINREGQWWWQITGKGGKTEQIPWTQNCMEALVRYRLSRQLSKYPSVQEWQPLVASVHGEKPISAGMLYKIVKRQVQLAAANLRQKDANAALKLEQSSTHWFRHTSLTHRANAGVDLRFLQALARHESLNTTQKYLHVEKEAFYQAINQKRTKPSKEDSIKSGK